MKVEFAPTKLSGWSEELTAPDNQARTDDYQSVVKLDTPQAVDADSPKPKPQQQVQKRSSVAIFGSTFLTIFLAEFGDKTQLSTLLMSAESQSPWAVFLGSGIALIATSLLGVILGQWLATRLAPKTLKTAAGLSLLLVAVMLFWDVAQS